MNKEPKTLPQAIKIIVGIYGKNVVKDVQMVNIMNDVVSLEDPAAVKSILRDVIKSGYGTKILAINTPREDYHLKVKAFSKEISDNYGYKEVIVQYILYSIAFGLSICPKEPYLKNTSHDKKVIQPPRKIVEQKKFEEIRKPHKIIVAIIVGLLIIGGICGVNFHRSSAAKEQFEKTIITGNAFLNQGDFDNAIRSYKEAYSNYNDINSDKYKKKAIDKIDAITDKLIKDGGENSNNLLLASKIVESELELDLDPSDERRLKDKTAELKLKIIERIDNGRNTLIMNLSASNGNLDKSGRKLLDELLLLSPNDYWLNFIKKKENE